MKHFQIWALLIVAFGVFVTLARAQESSTPYAAVTEDALWVYGVGDEPVMVSQGEFESIDWSNDGTKLAFIRYNEDYSSRLMVADVNNLASPVEINLTGSLETDMPATFTADNRLLFAQQPANTGTTVERQTEFYTVGLEVGAVPQFVAAADYEASCAYAGPFTYGHNRWFDGNYLTLEWTTAGIVYSTSCSGQGTALFNLQAGESVALGTYLASVSLSPDGRQLAGIPNHQDDYSVIQIIDLATMTLTEAQMPEYPKQIVWRADGTLLYSARIRDGFLTDAQSRALRSAENIPPPANGMYDDAAHFQVSIHQYDLASNEDSTLFTGDGSWIGNLVIVDAQTLVFTQAPNANALADALLAGTVNALAEDYAQQADIILAPEVFMLNLNDGSTQSLGIGLRQYTPYLGSEQ